MQILPASPALLPGGRQLDLDPIYAVDAVHEEDEDEYERYLAFLVGGLEIPVYQSHLHPIL